MSHRSYELTSMIRNDDLRLAATEACAQAIEETSPGTGSRVRAMMIDDRGLFLEIEPFGRFDRAPEGLNRLSGRRRAER